MSDHNRRWALPESMDDYADCELELAQREWSDLRRDGWLSGAPAVPSIDDVGKAFALLAVISEPEPEELGEAEDEMMAIDWLN